MNVIRGMYVALAALAMLGLGAVLMFVSGSYFSGDLDRLLCRPVVVAPQQQIAGQEVSQDALLRVPERVKIIGFDFVEIRAETKGKLVIWQPMNPELKIRSGGDGKSCLVIAKKPGLYSVQAWTAVDGLPTINAICLVEVEAEPPEPAIQPTADPKAEKKPNP